VKIYIVIEVYTKKGVLKRWKLGKRYERMCANCGHTYKKHRSFPNNTRCTVKGCDCKEFRDV
jgi:hypothetical protein